MKFLRDVVKEKPKTPAKEPNAPGQTVTSGDWGKDGQNQALRRKIFGDKK